MDTASQSSFHIEASPFYDECVAQLSHAVDEHDEAHLQARIDAPCCDNSSMTIKRQPIYVS
jgi:hypothetical protein